jgi:ABC-type transport system involved in Fe-S cluster assembly fused permease/ATPase subunit
LAFQTLFDESIDENIRFSIPSASHEQVIAAAKLADAHDFIMQFPKGKFCFTAKGLAVQHIPYSRKHFQGYHTAVGEGSTLISGGEKQRIAIARALIKKPLLLLLGMLLLRLKFFLHLELTIYMFFIKLINRRSYKCIRFKERASCPDCAG